MNKAFKNLFASILLLLPIISFTSCDSGQPTIAIVKYGEHTSLDEIENGIVTTLNNNLEGYNIKQYDCAFDAAIISQTLDALKDKNLAAIVTIATPVAIAAVSKFSDVPVIFAAVSNPSSLGVIANNVTGTSDAINLDNLVDLAFKVNPNGNRIGYIYTNTEANSVANYNKLKDLSVKKDFTLIEKTIFKTADLTETFNSIKNKIDALIVTDDNNVAAGMSGLASLCAEANIAMYCSADSEIRDGGMIGISVSYTRLAEYTASQVISILKDNKTPAEVPIKYFDEQEDYSLYYNSNFLNKAKGITVSEEILKDAIDLA